MTIVWSSVILNPQYNSQVLIMDGSFRSLLTMSYDTVDDGPQRQPLTNQAQVNYK